VDIEDIEMTKHHLLCTFCFLAFLTAATTGQGAFYYFDYETSLTNNNGGSGTNSLTSFGTNLSLSTTGGGANGTAQFADFGGGNNADAAHQILDATTDNISLANFKIELSFNNQGLAGTIDDYLSFHHTGLAANESYGVLYNVANQIVFRTEGSGNPASTAVFDDSDWHQVEITGTASGADALISIDVDGAAVGGGVVTIVGGASETLTIIQFSGRLDGLDNRYITAEIDEIRIIGIPEPGTALLLALGLVGLGVVGRRRTMTA
jgi:hypothetical protein